MMKKHRYLALDGYLCIPKVCLIKNTAMEEYRSLIKLGFPVLITQIGVILVSFIDTAMVGAYGVSELASAAFVNSIFMIPVVMQMGFSQGTTPLIGALFGQKKTTEIGRTLRSGIEVNFWISVCFTIIMAGVFFLLPYFGQDADLLPVIRPYYLAILPGLIPMALFNTCQQTSNGLTDTRTPMWIILGANVLNIIGNYALIFGHFGFPEMGLLGAGLSTLAARMAGAIAILVFFAHANRFRPYWSEARNSTDRGPERRRMWNTSYPVMTQCGLEVALWSFGAVACGWFGKVQLASYQVVNTIAQLGFMVFISFGVATSIKVANYTGKEDRGGVIRIARAGLRINLLLATLACLVFYLGGEHLIGLFSSDAEVVKNAMTLIIPLILYQYMDAVQLTYANALRGTSKVKPLMFVAAAAYVAVGIPAAYLLGVTAGLANIGVYYSFSIALLVAAVLLWFYFRRAARGIGAFVNKN